jgi:hypothetical protein
LYIHVYDGPQPENICGGEMMCAVVFETIENMGVGKKGVTQEFGPGGLVAVARGESIANGCSRSFKKKNGWHREGLRRHVGRHVSSHRGLFYDSASSILFSLHKAQHFL